MEPFSILAVTTAACQFLDFATKIVHGTWTIYKADPGQDSNRNSHVRTILEDVKITNDKLRASVQNSVIQQLSSEDDAVLKLAKECDELAARLIAALDALQKKNETGKGQLWSSFLIALKSVLSSKEIDALKEDLKLYREQMKVHVIINQQ
jgi:hypothetical protein